MGKLEDGETEVTPDREHGDKPDHVDVVTKVDDIGGVVKMGIDGNGNIFESQVWVGDKKADI